MIELKGVTNYRYLNRRCCANCAYWYEEPAAGNDKSPFLEWYCKRPDGPNGTWDNCEPEWYVCDGYKRNA